MPTMTQTLTIAALMLVAVAVGAFLIPQQAPLTIVGDQIVGEDGLVLTGKNVCAGGQTQSFDLNVYDKDNVNTAFTDPMIYRKVGDLLWTDGTMGTAITTLEVGEDYEFILGISKSDFIDEAYGAYHRFNNIPCIFSTNVEAVDNAAETTLTWTFYNKDNNAAGQTMVANTDYKLDSVVYAASEDVFGNPYIDTVPGLSDIGAHSIKYPNMYVLELNSTQMDIPKKVTVSGLDGRGQALVSEEMDKIPCPQRLAGNADDNQYCYEFPVVGSEDMKITTTYDTDDTIAPGVDDAGYLYAGGIFINDDGEVAWGVETTLGAAVANDAYDSIVVDVTA